MIQGRLASSIQRCRANIAGALPLVTLTLRRRPAMALRRMPPWPPPPGLQGPSRRRTATPSLPPRPAHVHRMRGGRAEQQQVAVQGGASASSGAAAQTHVSLGNCCCRCCCCVQRRECNRRRPHVGVILLCRGQREVEVGSEVVKTGAAAPLLPPLAPALVVGLWTGESRGRQAGRRMCLVLERRSSMRALPRAHVPLPATCPSPPGRRLHRWHSHPILIPCHASLQLPSLPACPAGSLPLPSKCAHPGRTASSTPSEARCRSAAARNLRGPPRSRCRRGCHHRRRLCTAPGPAPQTMPWNGGEQGSAAAVRQQVRHSGRCSVCRQRGSRDGRATQGMVPANAQHQKPSSGARGCLLGATHQGWSGQGVLFCADCQQKLGLQALRGERHRPRERVATQSAADAATAAAAAQLLPARADRTGTVSTPVRKLLQGEMGLPRSEQFKLQCDRLSRPARRPRHPPSSPLLACPTVERRGLLLWHAPAPGPAAPGPRRPPTGACLTESSSGSSSRPSKDTRIVSIDHPSAIEGGWQSAERSRSPARVRPSNTTRFGTRVIDSTLTVPPERRSVCNS